MRATTIPQNTHGAPLVPYGIAMVNHRHKPDLGETMGRFLGHASALFIKAYACHPAKRESFEISFLAEAEGERSISCIE